MRCVLSVEVTGYKKRKKERWMCGPSGIRTQVYQLIIKAGRSTALPRGLGSGVPSGTRTQDSGQVGPSVLPLHQWNWEPKGVKGYINHTQNMPDMSSRRDWILSPTCESLGPGRSEVHSIELGPPQRNIRSCSIYVHSGCFLLLNKPPYSEHASSA